jgi:uncharacterized protein (TIRG00374 family)
MKWVTRISLVVGAGALIATIWFVGPAVIVGHLREIGAFFALIVAVDVLSSVFDATAVYFMAHVKGAPSWRQCVVAQLAGRGVNAVTPGGNLGEPLKVGLLSRHSPTKRIVAAIMYVGLMLVVISFVVIAIGTAATAFLFDVPRAGIIALLVGAAIAAGIAVTIMVLIHRGMLSTLTGLLARVRILSKQRRDKWKATLEEVDARLRGQDVARRRHALVFLLLSQALQKFLTFLVVYAAGYTLSPGQFLSLVSAGVLLGWISSIIPMGLGISEGGNVALFSLIGAPSSLGLALALARRVNQVVFASIGFAVLTADRVGTHIHGRVRRRWEVPPKPSRPAPHGIS